MPLPTLRDRREDIAKLFRFLKRIDADRGDRREAAQLPGIGLSSTYRKLEDLQRQGLLKLEDAFPPDDGQN